MPPVGVKAAAASAEGVSVSGLEERLDRFLGGPLPALTPHTITTRRALRQELEHVRARARAATLDELEDGLAGMSGALWRSGGG